MQRKILEKLNLARLEKHAVVLITHLENSEQYLYSESKEYCIGIIPTDLEVLAKQAARLDRSKMHETESGKIFFHAFNPSLRMFIVGAVHISQTLAPLAVMCGYDVTVIDPRQAFATNERFPDININTAWPDEALNELVPDNRTAVVALTHDPKLDDPALTAALNSDAFYIGALGSRKTQTGRQQRLEEKGFSPEQQQRICGPIGLNIGAQSPAEIALSIMAQVTEQARQGSVHNEAESEGK
ncbi:MAG: XdhC family protein [Proteobacteria bacterium]|nr:xanthine dehydrogenase [Pseudomonadota bacterium]NOG59538.1 XdhC family protein [Pseudomonadota bacterium]